MQKEKRCREGLSYETSLQTTYGAVCSETRCLYGRWQCPELEERGSKSSGGGVEVPVGGRGSPGLFSLPVLLPAALLQPGKQQLLALLRATC